MSATNTTGLLDALRATYDALLTSYPLHSSDMDKRGAVLAQARAAIAAEEAAQTQPAAVPVAWVPIHPRNGPLWSMATADPSPERLPNSYPLRPISFCDAPAAQVPAVPAQAVLRQIKQLAASFFAGNDKSSKAAGRLLIEIESAATAALLATAPAQGEQS